MSQKTKQCSVCLRHLDKKTDFEHSKHSKGDFIRSICRTCHQVQRNVNFSKTPKKYLKALSTSSKSSRTTGSKSFAWEIEHEYIYRLWEIQNGRCAMTGHPMTWHRGNGGSYYNASIDRKDPDQGYVVGNIQLVCNAINFMKGTLTDAELIWWCRSITLHKDSFTNDDD